MNEIPKANSAPEQKVVLEPGETIATENPAVIVYEEKEFFGRTHFDALQKILDEDANADPEKMRRLFRTTGGKLLTENEALHIIEKGRVRPGTRSGVLNSENLDASDDEE